MPDDLATVIAQHVAAQVPVREIYSDAVSPAAKQGGKLLEDLAKCCRLALVPFQIGAYYQDRIERFIQRSAERVEEKNREVPPLEILGPVLEGIRYEREGSISEEAFSQLLSAAFDRERVGQAHPAFPNLIRVLADDEFRLLSVLGNRSCTVLTGWRANGDFVMANREEEGKKIPELALPGQLFVYLNHLEALGLIDDLMAFPAGTRLWNDVTALNNQWRVSLSEFGTLFLRSALDGRERRSEG